ncbi:IST1 homolog isoform X2 [Lithobates pipiens]
MAGLFKKSFKKDVTVYGMNIVLKKLGALKTNITKSKDKIKEQIAEFLRDGETERACTQAKVLIRGDSRVQALDLLEVYCTLIVEQIGLIHSMKDLDPSLAEAVSTILWAAPRLMTEIPEISTVADQLSNKYGKGYRNKCQENTHRTVNQTVIQKLSVEAPPKFLVDEYLQKIATEFNIQWQENVVRRLSISDTYERHLFGQPPSLGDMPASPTEIPAGPQASPPPASGPAVNHPLPTPLLSSAPGAPQPGDLRPIQPMANVTKTERSSVDAAVSEYSRDDEYLYEIIE